MKAKVKLETPTFCSNNMELSRLRGHLMQRKIHEGVRMEKKFEKRQYAKEFKLDAVRLVVDEGYSVPKAAELGISAKTQYHWKRQYEAGKLISGMKRAQPTVEEVELRRLREENRQLKLETEILKKASAYRSL